MPGNEAELAVLRQLQKTFHCCQQQLDATQAALAHTTQSLSTLVNQAQQYKAVKATDIACTALAEHPELKPRLLHKLTQNVEESVASLHKVLKHLQEAESRVRLVCENTTSLYQRYSPKLEIEALTMGAATWPSIAIMLEWTLQLQHLFHQDLVLKETSLENLTFSDPETLQVLQTHWTDTGQLKAAVNEILFHVQYFLEERF